MKIYLINNLYKPYNRGGAEQIVKLQAEGLIKAGHEVLIITTKPLFVKSEIRNPCLAGRQAKSEIYYLSGFYYNLNRLPKILRLPWHLLDMFDIGSYLRIKNILKKAKPDVIITHNLKGVGYLIPKAIKRLKIKHVHILHDVQLIHPSGLIICGQEKKCKSILAKIYAKTCARLFRSPSIVISPSKWLLTMHNDFFKNSKKIVLPNPAPSASSSPLLPVSPERSRGGARRGADLSRPSRLGEAGRSEAEAEDKVFSFLYVGQIEKHKGILFLIKTFNLFCHNINRCGFQLLIVGQGSKLKQAKKTANNNQAIKFLGQANQEEVQKLMLETNCLIIPSLCYENSPTVIYEAASHGLPIIASRIGGITELIQELNGLLFKPGNEGDLMHQLSWAIGNPEKLSKIGLKSQQAVGKFSLENYIKKLLEII